MPFSSKAQQRWMFANKPKTAHRWAKHTDNIKDLPEKVSLDLSRLVEQLPKSGLKSNRPFDKLYEMSNRALSRAQGARVLAKETPRSIAYQSLSDAYRKKALAGHVKSGPLSLLKGHLPIGADRFRGEISDLRLASSEAKNRLQASFGDKHEIVSHLDNPLDRMLGTARSPQYYFGDQAAKTAEERVEGGIADHLPDSLFEKKDLKKGMKVESEHTSSKSVAKEIAKDHLSEDKEYYNKLEDMEKKANLEKIAGWLSPRKLKANSTIQ